MCRFDYFRGMLPCLTPELHRALALIRPPADYYTGTPPLETPVPGNILLFTRTHTRDLGDERAYHHRFVFVTNLAGPGRVILDHRMFDFPEGNSFLFFPFQFHHYVIGKPGAIMWAFLTFELPRYEHLAPLRDRPLRIDGESFGILESIVKKYPARHSPGIANSELVLLTAQLLNRISGLGVGSRGQVECRNVRENVIFDKIHRYIGGNLGSGPEIRDIARHVGVSESHLRLRYRRATGMSLGRYVRELRVRKAMALLANSGLNVSEVAYACGYESVSAFSRAFRNQVGASPREYQRQPR